MKKKRKRILALTLAFLAITVTAGCTRSENKANDSSLNSPLETSVSHSEDFDRDEGADTAADTVSAKGRYIETQISLPEGFSSKGGIRRLADSRLVLLDAANGTKSISEDNGKTWKTETVAELERIMGRGGAEFTSAALSEDGGVFVSYISWEETDAGKSCPEKYLYFTLEDPGETMHMFELGIEDYKTNVTESVFTADGRLFAVTATANVYEISLEKESCKHILALENGAGADICSNGESVIAADSRKAYFYDLETGEVTDEDEVLNVYLAKQSEKSFGLAMCAAKNGKDKRTMYLAGCNGIAGHVIGGSVMEQLVDGALSGLGDPSRAPEEIIQNDDGSFLVLFEDGELDSYVYNKEVSAVPEQQLSIYGLYDNETVRQAVSLFRKKYPDVFVRFEAGLNGAAGMTKNDAVKNLNTELLAGDGPDMILLDGMPADSYQEKGMLMDLSDLAAELQRSDDYFEGILNGYRSEEGVYILPFRYEIPLLAGESDSLSKISDLKTLANEAERLAGLQTTEETVLGSYSPEDILEKLCLTSANIWMDGNGTVNRAALEDFLVQAERIYQADQKNLDPKELETRREYVEHINRSYKNDERAAGKVLQSVSRVFSRLQGTQVLTAGYLSSMADFRMVTSVQRELNKTENSFTYQIWNGQGSELFCPSGTIGICADSPNQELAQEFIRVLLGSDVQGRDFEDGFPVNASAYQAFTADPQPDRSFSMGAEDREGKEVMLGMPWPDERELEQLKTMIQSLKTPAVLDDSLKNEVITIGAQALRGDKTIEDSAEEISQKMSLYLKE